MNLKWCARLRCWLVLLLGGYWDSSAKGLMLHLGHVYIPSPVWKAAEQSVKKVAVDPSFAQPLGAHLGREIRRDEAAEWAKHYLHDAGFVYRDADVNLACELVYHLNYR